jgi:NO-binding membrane sensor protein with MHYT domain
MSQIGAPLVGSHDLRLVALSILSVVLASYVVLDLAAYLRPARGGVRWLTSPGSHTVISPARR